MLVVSIELLHGTFRGDPDGTANTGLLPRGEWPPSPSRLFAALVAADGTRNRCTVTDGSELAWFEKLPPPTIFADTKVHHQKLNPRFVVEHGSKGSSHLEYVGKKGTIVRPGIRVAPCSPHIIYSWNTVSATPSILHALQRRAARIGYFGASDSPVRMRVRNSMPDVNIPSSAFVPDDNGDTLISVSMPGDLELLDRRFDLWREHGANVGRNQFPRLRHRVRYRKPAILAQSSGHGEVVAWLRIDTAVSGRRISLMTDLFKKSVLSHYQRLYGEPPAVLHGHGFGAKGYDLARYLALPDVNYPRSRGRIHGLALWMPPKSDSGIRQRTRDASLAVSRLKGRLINVSVYPTVDMQRPIAAHPDRWRGPSRFWVTAFPAIHERRTPLTLAEITRWCRHAGLPKPVDFRESRTPLITGAVDLSPPEVNRPNRPPLPYSHIALNLCEKVSGPVVIGSGRQRGFGLCAPLTAKQFLQS